MAERILVVDDEPQMRRALRAMLQPHGYRVETAETGMKALDTAANYRPDVVILDLRLPDMDGREVCTRLRDWSRVPVIVVSVIDDEGAKVQALDLGADDYLVKPFAASELLARIRAARRRVRDEVAAPIVESGELCIDLASRRVTVAGRSVRLTPKEYDVLTYLAVNAGKVVTHQMLLTHVWGPESANDLQYLRVFVSLLRHKIEPDPDHPHYILTEVGVGYTFVRDT